MKRIIIVIILSFCISNISYALEERRRPDIYKNIGFKTYNIGNYQFSLDGLLQQLQARTIIDCSTDESIQDIGRDFSNYEGQFSSSIIMLTDISGGIPLPRKPSQTSPISPTIEPHIFTPTKDNATTDGLFPIHEDVNFETIVKPGWNLPKIDPNKIGASENIDKTTIATTQTPSTKDTNLVPASLKAGVPVEKVSSKERGNISYRIRRDPDNTRKRAVVRTEKNLNTPALSEKGRGTALPSRGQHSIIRAGQRAEQRSIIPQPSVPKVPAR